MLRKILNIFRFRKIREATYTNPASFANRNPARFANRIGWVGNGVLANFRDWHDLEILVSDDTEQFNEKTFEKTWWTDADEIFFRNGKQIKLYWR